MSKWTMAAIEARVNWSELEKAEKDIEIRWGWTLLGIAAVAGGEVDRAVAIVESARKGLGLRRLVSVDTWGVS